MERRVVYPVVVVLCLLAAMAGYLMPGIPWQQVSSKGAVWSIIVDGNKFDETGESETHIQQLTVTNSSSEPKNLEFGTDCSCSAVVPSKVQLAPNETTKILMTLNTTFRKQHQQGVAKWLHTSTLIVNDKTVAETREYKITGYVHAKASSSIPWLEFGGLLTQNEPGVSLSCRYILHDNTSNIIAAENVSKYTIGTMVLLDKKTSILTITPNTNRQPADFSFDIKIEAVDEEGKRSYVAPLRVRGYIAPKLQSYPEIVTISGTGKYSSADAHLLCKDGFELKSITSSSDRIRSDILQITSSELRIRISSLTSVEKHEWEWLDLNLIVNGKNETKRISITIEP